ncbi:extensin-like [Homarus americanus]|uniref:extensin-like n=1 Tax=Homarus americanus TaxID=6706 RepID=UPI001C48A36C|nr:extensin-like [Homarus americanus]
MAQNPRTTHGPTPSAWPCTHRGPKPSHYSWPYTLSLALHSPWPKTLTLFMALHLSLPCITVAPNPHTIHGPIPAPWPHTSVALHSRGKPHYSWPTHHGHQLGLHSPWPQTSHYMAHTQLGPTHCGPNPHTLMAHTSAWPCTHRGPKPSHYSWLYTLSLALHSPWPKTLTLFMAQYCTMAPHPQLALHYRGPKPPLLMALHPQLGPALTVAQNPHTIHGPIPAPWPHTLSLALHLTVAPNPHTIHGPTHQLGPALTGLKPPLLMAHTLSLALHSPWPKTSHYSWPNTCTMALHPQLGPAPHRGPKPSHYSWPTPQLGPALTVPKPSHYSWTQLGPALSPWQTSHYSWPTPQLGPALSPWPQTLTLFMALHPQLAPRLTVAPNPHTIHGPTPSLWSSIL